MRRLYMFLASFVQAIAVSALNVSVSDLCDQHVMLHTRGDEYRCSGIVLQTLDGEASVDCHGAALDCSKLPRLPFAGGGQLLRLLVRNCSELSSCILSVVNATGTHTLFVQATQLTPDVHGFEMVNSLFLYHENQSTVQDAIRKFPNLKVLHLKGTTLTALPLHTFNQSSALEFMHISYTKIRILRTDVFNELKKLNILILLNNSLEVIEENAFRGLDSLQELTLVEDKRGLHLRTGTLSNLDRLEKIVLRSHELTLDPGTFSLPSLQSLEIRDSALRTMHPDIFVHTTALVNLNLSGNNLSSLPETIFGGLKRLRLLNLSYNQLDSISKEVFEPLTQLQELYLDGNFIQTLHNTLLYSPAYKVGLSYNRISSIEDAFNANVTDLDLSHNDLAWSCVVEKIVNGATHTFKPPSPLEKLKNLSILRLGHNRLSSVCGDWTSEMYHLVELDLSHNNLTRVTGEESNFINHDVKVDFRNNPFHCDCHLYDFIISLRQRRFNVNATTCYQPHDMKDVNIAAIPPWNLTCPVLGTNNCTCLVRPKNRTECDCQELTKTLPDPVNSVWGNKEMLLRLHKPRNLKEIPKFVTALNLSHLGIETAPNNFPETVMYVDLSGNSLSYISVDILQRNLTLKLNGNPLNCDCSSTVHVDNLQKYYSKIEDYDSLICTDGDYVYKKIPSRLCDLRLAITIGTSLTILGVVIASLCIFFYRYSVEIRLYLDKIGCPCFDREKIMDANKKYDIFLSYVYKDEVFVKNELLKPLEEVYGYKVCIHTRDWIVGDRIPDQIYRSVAESRKTLIVLSNAFIEPDHYWALEEFRAAHDQTNKDSIERAIVIIVGEVDFKKAPDLVTSHIGLNTYIKWGEFLFWQRLNDALRKLTLEEQMRREKLQVSNEKGELQVTKYEIVELNDTGMVS